MPVLQVRDVPEPIYRRLVELAEKERRSLAQQALALLAQALRVEMDPKARRQAVLRAIQHNQARTASLSDPARLIREDRNR